jgi:hypothetical protein
VGITALANLTASSMEARDIRRFFSLEEVHCAVAKYYPPTPNILSQGWIQGEAPPPINILDNVLVAS